MADAVDVNAATGDVGGDQHANLALAKALQRADALVLRDVAGHLRCTDAILGQTLFDASYFVLAIGEDHYPRPVVLGDQVVQQLVLVAAGHGIDVLLDGIAGHVLRFDLDHGGVGRPLLRQVHHVVGEGGGKEQGLAFALGWRLPDDLADLRDEAHVEHAVGLVEDHHLDHVQVHLTALVEVQQPAGGGHQDVAVARLQLLELLVEIHAADKAHHVESGVLGQVQRIVGDLHHQFASRSDDQGTRLAHVAFLGRWRFQQLGDGRDQEGRRLACAGLCTADGIAALERVAQHLSLDRRAIGEAQVMDRVHQLRCELEVMKAGLAFGRLDHEVFQLPGRRGGFRRFAAALATRFVGAALGGLRLGLGFVRRARLRHGVGLPFGSGRWGAGGYAGPLVRGLAKDFLECFEHGLLVVELGKNRASV